MTDRRNPDHFHGEVAERYEERRLSAEHWAVEQAAVEVFIAGLSPGQSILDVPVGTGRFFPYYAANSIRVTGLDLSSDMLAQAQRRAHAERLDAQFGQGSVFDLPFTDGEFHAVVCFRLMTWFRIGQIRRASLELARVASGSVLVTAHTWKPIREMGDFRDRVRLVASRMALRWRSRGGRVAERRHPVVRVERALAGAGLRTRRTEVMKETKFGRYLLWEMKVEKRGSS